MERLFVSYSSCVTTQRVCVVAGEAVCSFSVLVVGEV